MLPRLINLVVFGVLTQHKTNFLFEIKNESHDTFGRSCKILIEQKFYTMWQLVSNWLGGIACVVEVEVSKFSKRSLKLKIGYVIVDNSKRNIINECVFLGKFFS